MTLAACLGITVSLLYMLYQNCTNQYVECVYPVLPMISDVICLPFYDRVFCLLTCFFTLACYQVDCRAFYHRLFGIATDCENDTLLVLGMISTFSLPAIGFFDEHTYGNIHNCLAVLFFGSVGIYAFIIGGVMQDNKKKFPVEQWVDIAVMNKVKWIMAISLLTLAISCALHGSNYWLTPLAEWVTTILYVNYFALLSFTNLYYDSVHAYNDAAFKPSNLTPQTEQVTADQDRQINTMA